MFRNTLPDIAHYNAGPPQMRGNTVIIADTRDAYFYPEHRTPYLFVTNFFNKGKYVVNGNYADVSDRQFYLLNENDRIEMRFRKAEPLKTLFILFDKDFVEGCLDYLADGDPALPAFPHAPLELNGFVRNCIAILMRQGAQPGCQENLDDLLFSLLTESCRLGSHAAGRIRKIQAVRKSTQEELYRRLAAAKEYMHDHLSGNLRIGDIAREVCMNKFHFLSTFKEAYDTTPHRYYTELKLQKAMDLLQSGTAGVADVCLQVGFESVGSFSNLFKRRFGKAPSQIPNFR